MRVKKNKSLFLERFGDTPQLRTMDFLIGNHFFDFPMTEIAKGANVSYNSIKTFFPSWIKEKIVIKTRRIGKSDYYKLNIRHPLVVALIKMDWMLTKRVLAPKLSEKILVSAV